MAIRALIAPLFLLLQPLSASAMPEGLIFHVSFDKLTPDADQAQGDRHSSFTGSLELRPAAGVKGAGLLQRAGERCTYSLAGNLDTSQGTFSVWVKPLNWDGHSGKFRHFLVVTAAPDYRMLVYLYPIGDEAVFNYIQLNAKTDREAIWRAGAPVDILKRNEWTHLVSTWDAHHVRLYANGKRVGEGLVGAPLPKLTTGAFTICPVEFWKHPRWSDPDEQTICDEVRIFNRALSEEEVLDLYAEEVPGGLAALKPALSLKPVPDYSGRRILLTAKPVHLDAAWKRRLAAGATLTLSVRDPAGHVLFTHAGALGKGVFTVPLPTWRDGDYVVTGKLTAGEKTLREKATLTKPPTPWLPAQRDWRADRVLDPWTPLHRTGSQVRYWNGRVDFPEALPHQIVTNGQPLLAGPIRLAAQSAATWSPSRLVEDKPFRVTFRTKGKLEDLALTATTLMEFDGLIRCDLALTPPPGGAALSSLTIEIPLRGDVAAWYRNPTCQPWDGRALAEPAFLPYGWLGNEDRGLSWFMESAANWRLGKGQPAVTLRRAGDVVTVRLHLISEPVRLEKALTYTVGFEPTPVRPLSPNLYTWRFASGPQIKGSNLFVYGWRSQISNLNGRLIASDPAKQRALVDRWRAAGKESLSYTCAQCTADLSPEYRFFAREWNQPCGATFSGYKRPPDNAPYSIAPVCPRSSFSDFLVWCVKQNLAHDWGGGIYTDIDGAVPCDNAAHGCGYVDSFGRHGRTWPLYAHRALSRRIYAACHDAGKLYFSHAHSNWYSLFNAFNDGWCPGEQFSSAVLGKPDFYMDGIPDRVWRAEFYSPTTGVATFLLPQLGRLAGKDALKDRGPSECCMAAALCYGVPLWAGSINRQVVEKVWTVEQDFGMKGARFVPWWKQREFTVSDPKVRVSFWKKGARRLVVLANFTAENRPVELRPAAGGPVTFRNAWRADDLTVTAGVARLTLPARRGVLLAADEQRKN